MMCSYINCKLDYFSMVRFAFLFILLFMFNMGCSGQQNHDCLNDEIDSLINDLDITGLDIAVVKCDTVIYNQSFGYKNLNLKEKYNRDDICWIGSISKTFVATAIMQLVDADKLNLEDDALKYLKFPLRNPSYPDIPITIRMLLTHKSSINDYGSWYSYDFINPNKNPDYNHYYLDFEPGAGYKYCNYNYNILGAVIEGATGCRFDDYIENNITGPIGMYGSFNCNRLDSTKFVTVYHYNEDDSEFEKSKVPYKSYKKYLVDDYSLGDTTGFLYPAAGMKTSAYELSKYMMMHMHNGRYKDRQILSPESEKEMRKINPGTVNYGLSFREYRGLISDEVLSGQTGGGTLGEKTAMIFHPEGKYGFVIITNGSRSRYIDGYEDIHKRLIPILYKYLLSDESK